MQTSNSTKNIFEAMVQASAEMPKILYNKINPHFGHKYADLSIIIELTKPILNHHGLAIVQDNVSYFVDGVVLVGVDTSLIHNSGEWITSSCMIPLPTDSKQSLAQITGQYNTYLRRYGWISMCGVIAEEDTDAEAAAPKPAVKPAVKPTPKPAPAKQPIPFTDDDWEEDDDGMLDPDSIDNLESQVKVLIKSLHNDAQTANPASAKAVGYAANLLHKVIKDEETYQNFLMTIGNADSMNKLDARLVRVMLDWFEPDNKTYTMSKQANEEVNMILLAMAQGLI